MRNIQNTKRFIGRHRAALALVSVAVLGALLWLAFERPLIEIALVVVAYTVLAVSKFILDFMYITEYRQQYFEEGQPDEQLPVQPASDKRIGKSPLEA